MGQQVGHGQADPVDGDAVSQAQRCVEPFVGWPQHLHTTAAALQGADGLHQTGEHGCGAPFHCWS